MSGRKLRVGIDVTPLLGPPTGIPAVTRGMVGALSRRTDIELSGWILSARGSAPALPDGMACVSSGIPAALVHRLWPRVTIPTARRVAGRVDVVHGTNYVVPPGPRTVLTLQDLSPILHPDWTGPAIARTGAIIRRAVGLGCVVHVPCERIRDDVCTHLGADPERVVVIHNAVDSVAGGSLTDGRRLAGAERFVLALGTTGQRKALPTLVEAMRALPTDVSLVVAGPVGDAETQLSAAVEANSLGGRFRRLISVDDTARRDLLAASTVLAFPSSYEGYGLPPLEALSVGVPVVATDVGALRELIGHEVELVEPDDASAFADALRASFQTPAPPSESLRSMIAGLTWESAAADLVGAYHLAFDHEL